MRQKITIIGLLILTLFLSIRSCIKEKELKSDFLSEKLKNQKLDSIKNKLDQTVYVQEAIIAKNQEELKKYTDSIFKLNKEQKRVKEVLAFYKANTKTELVEVDVPYLDTLQLKKWEDSIQQRCSSVIDYYDANTISVPRTAKDSTAHYNVDFEIRKDSLRINKIEFKDSQYIRFVTKKGGFLKKDTYGKRKLFLKRKIEVQVLHTNPYLKIENQSSVVYSPPKNKNVLGKLFILGTVFFIGTQL